MKRSYTNNLEKKIYACGLLETYWLHALPGPNKIFFAKLTSYLPKIIVTGIKRDHQGFQRISTVPKFVIPRKCSTQTKNNIRDNQALNLFNHALNDDSVMVIGAKN